MLHTSPLKRQTMGSPLGGQSVLKPRGWKANRQMIFTLALTSLIDAFSILVIFLLINGPDNGTGVQANKNIVLPEATSASKMEVGTIIRIEQGRYFVDNREVLVSELTQRLFEAQKKINKKTEVPRLIIQADRKSDYSLLNPVIMAAAQTGYQQFKFAVLPGAGAKL